MPTLKRIYHYLKLTKLGESSNFFEQFKSGCKDPFFGILMADAIMPDVRV